jgi:hypothetical protein
MDGWMDGWMDGCYFSHGFFERASYFVCVLGYIGPPVCRVVSCRDIILGGHDQKKCVYYYNTHSRHIYTTQYI